MKKLNTWLAHFAAHLQCTQANAAKAIIAKELQTNAATGSRITIDFLQNIINKTNPNKLLHYYSKSQFSKQKTVEINYECRSP